MRDLLGRHTVSDFDCLWRFNTDLDQWELGYYDLPRKCWAILGIVTSEFIGRVATPRLIADRMRDRLGSVPPPLERHLTPDPPIVPWDWSNP